MPKLIRKYKKIKQRPPKHKPTATASLFSSTKLKEDEELGILTYKKSSFNTTNNNKTKTVGVKAATLSTSVVVAITSSESSETTTTANDVKAAAATADAATCVVEKAEDDLLLSKKPSKWSAEEDQKLVDLVAKYYGHPKKWSQVANELPGRIRKQCRERWYNHLDPTISKAPWSEDEDRFILTCFRDGTGGQWSKMSQQMVGRPDNAIKNHWNNGMKRKVEEYIYNLNIDGVHRIKNDDGVYLIGDGIEGCLLAVRVRSNEEEKIQMKNVRPKRFKPIGHLLTTQPRIVHKPATAPQPRPIIEVPKPKKKRGRPVGSSRRKLQNGALLLLADSISESNSEETVVDYDSIRKLSPLAAAAVHDKHDVAYLQEKADWMKKKLSDKMSSDFESTNFDIDTKSQSLYPKVQYGMPNTKKRAQPSSTKADNKALIKKIKEKLLSENKD